MQIIENAVKRARSLIDSDKVRCIYDKAENDAKSMHGGEFFDSFQSLSVCIGDVVDELLVYPKRGQFGSYDGNVIYLCNILLDDPALADRFQKVNPTNVNIESCVNMYNHLINRLVITLGVYDLKRLAIVGLQQAYASAGLLKQKKQKINAETQVGQTNPEEKENKREDFVLSGDANRCIEQQLREKSTVEIYKNVIRAVNDKQETSFVMNMQAYITRMGVLISKQSLTTRMTDNTYTAAVDFLGDVLHNNSLKNMLKATEVNELGNIAKHSVENVEADIKECLHQYNRLVKDIVDKLALTAFRICYVNFDQPTDERRLDDLFADKDDEKFSAIGDVKFRVALSAAFTMDRYRKTLNAFLTLGWPEERADYVFEVEVRSPLGHMLSKKVRIAADEKGVCDIEIAVPKNCLEGYKLSVTVHVGCYAKECVKRSTGILFWKKEHVDVAYKCTGSSNFVLSKVLRPSDFSQNLG